MFIKSDTLFTFGTACFIVCILATSCSETNNEEGDNKMKGVNLSMMDTTTSVCEDFYRFANGKWLDNTDIPSTESRWGSFNELRDKNYELIKTILEDAANDRNAEEGSDRSKVGMFYRTAMDTASRNKIGIKALQDELDKINSIGSKSDLIELIAHLHLINVSVLFDFRVDQDMKNSERYLFELSQGGMGLPIPELYYDPAKAGPLKNLYLVHIRKMFLLTGQEPKEAEENADIVMNIESQLAEHAMTAVQQRDLDAQYNLMSLEDLSTLTPSFDWSAYLNLLNIHPEEVMVAQPDFFKQVEVLLQNTDLNSWKVYFRWYLLHKMASNLSDDFVRENFSFYGTAMSGTKKMNPLWKRSLESANHNMGQLLGKEFVKKAFSKKNKVRLNKLIDNLILVFRERLQNLEWMSNDSKKTAYAKLDSLTRKIGYPDKWLDFSYLQLTDHSFVENCIRCQRFWVRYHLSKLGKPVDKTEWQIPPQIVNAFYNPTTNSICFPAGILQPPFMDPEADDAVLYGTIGAVIGHELTHGFDDMGKQFDANGNKRNWWTEEDSARFKKRTNKLVEQFNKFEVLDSIFINGELTLGENIADLGGLIMAYYAFQKAKEGKEDYKIDGYMSDQLFFISYAQLWKAKSTDEEAKRLAMLDPHSPPRFRVFGALSNMPEFYKTFHCKQGNAYNIPDQDMAVIW